MSGIAARLDAVYDRVDPLCHAGRWDEVDALLRDCDVGEPGWGGHHGLALLILTRAAPRDRLPSRPALIERMRAAGHQYEDRH